MLLGLCMFLKINHEYSANVIIMLAVFADDILNWMVYALISLQHHAG